MWEPSLNITLSIINVPAFHYYIICNFALQKFVTKCYLFNVYQNGWIHMEFFIIDITENYILL